MSPVPIVVGDLAANKLIPRLIQMKLLLRLSGQNLRYSTMMGFYTLCLFCILPCIIAQEKQEEWGYVTVRPGAHMFWWLYRSPVDWHSKPLVMWLQGGPGVSSSGFGNFIEIGPLDVNLQPRQTTWLQSANLLFVDNPVGTGYSYVERNDLLTTNVSEIAADLLTTLKQFYAIYHYNDVPFYIFCESYGGKMVAAFGAMLHKAVQDKKISCNFKGVALGDSWISPIDSVGSWGPVLFANSLINAKQLEALNILHQKTEAALNLKQFKAATALWAEMEDYIDANTDHVDIYNFLVHGSNSISLSFNPGYSPAELKLCKAIARHLLQDDALSALMNGPIRTKLGSTIPTNVTWGGQSDAVFRAQDVDFMKDVIADVDYLLSADVKVVIYSGQLDIICATQGTMAWINKLKWKGLSEFLAAKRMPVYATVANQQSSKTDAFVQEYDNMIFYWILNAGHMVPKDNGEMALKMLNLVIGS